MKHLKLFPVLMLALLAAVTFASCSDDDDEGSSVDKAKLIGTWILESQDKGIYGISNYTGNEGGSITFNADGTGHMVQGSLHEQIMEWGSDYDFTWRTSGNGIDATTETIHGSSGDFSLNAHWTVVSLTDNAMTLSCNIDAADLEVITCTFTKSNN